MFKILSTAALAAVVQAIQLQEVQVQAPEKHLKHPAPFVTEEKKDENELHVHLGPAYMNENWPMPRGPEDWGKPNESDSSYKPGVVNGGNGNAMQFITNAIIHAEIYNFSRLVFDEDVQNFMKEYMFTGLPLNFTIDRTPEQGRVMLSDETVSCGDMDYESCRVGIDVRVKISLYYWRRWIPKKCGDPDYQGLTVHLRDNPDGNNNYRQPPCQIYTETAKKFGFKSMRMFGVPSNPCINWINKWHNETDTGIELQDLTGRDFEDDFCESIEARNLFLGVSTFSQNAMLVGGSEGRHIFSMIPTWNDDPFAFFGGIGNFSTRMCKTYRFTGVYGVPKEYFTATDTEFHEAPGGDMQTRDDPAWYNFHTEGQDCKPEHTMPATLYTSAI